MIELDVETSGLQWYAHEAFMVQFWDGTGEVEIFDPRNPADAGAIQSWLDRGKTEGLNAHNSKFDYHFIESAGFTLPDPSMWHDSMVLAHVVDERTSTALKARSAALFGDSERDLEKAVKTWLNDETKARRKAGKEREKAGEDGAWEQPNYSDVPAELMRPYAANDCVLAHKLREIYEPRLTGELKSIYELEMKVMGALYDAEVAGVPIDTAAARRFELTLAGNVEQLHDRCVELAGIKHFNPNSSDQIAEALKRRGADLTFVTKSEKTGKPSMDKENLGAVDDLLARAIEDFRTEYKVANTYVRPMLQRSWENSIKAWKEPFIVDGRIHPNFRQVGARTGRMSCSDPNVQNWPRDDLRLRYLFRAEPGKKLVTCDLDSIELMLLAAFAGEGRMLRTILEDGDLHELTAKMTGLKDRERAGGVLESARDRGKRMNYLQIYGGGIRTMRKTFGFSQNEARQLLNLYAETYPEVERLGRRIQYRLEDTGYVQTPWGRRHRCFNAQREGYKFINYLIQGTAADLLKDSLVRLWEQGVPVVAAVHDELIVHCDEGDAAEVAHLLEVEMTNHPVIGDKVPLGAKAAIVDRWSDAKNPGYVPDYERSAAHA